MEKIILVSLIPVAVAIILSITAPVYLPAQQAGSIALITTPLLGSLGAAIFIVQRHLARRDKTEQNKREHCKTLRQDVLDHWLKQRVKKGRQKDSFYESLIPLYVSILEDLKSPIHFSRFKSHLTHDKYKDVREPFEDLDRREPVHNRKVSEYMRTIERKIRTRILTREDTTSGDCTIDNIILYESGHEPRTPNCIMPRAVFYFRDKSQKEVLDLDVRLVDEKNNIFQLYVTPDTAEIGRGDEEAMKCLSMKIKSIEPVLIDSLKALIAERDALVELFDSKLMPKIKEMAADLDEGHLSGECIVELRLKSQR